MGYFSNGTEGNIYESEYCEKCVHYDHKQGEDKPCPIWMHHLLHNGTNNEYVQEILNSFITVEGIENKKCKSHYIRHT